MIRHVRCPNFEAVGLDFGPMEVYPGGIGHRFAFVGLLPNAGLDVEDIVRAFSPSAWPELQRVMVEKHGVVRLPRMNACPSCSASRNRARHVDACVAVLASVATQPAFQGIARRNRHGSNAWVECRLRQGVPGCIMSEVYPWRDSVTSAGVHWRNCGCEW